MKWSRKTLSCASVYSDGGVGRGGCSNGKQFVFSSALNQEVIHSGKGTKRIGSENRDGSLNAQRSVKILLELQLLAI